MDGFRHHGYHELVVIPKKQALSCELCMAETQITLLDYNWKNYRSRRKDLRLLALLEF